jgi:hypothetical protein
LSVLREKEPDLLFVQPDDRDSRIAKVGSDSTPMLEAIAVSLDEELGLPHPAVRPMDHLRREFQMNMRNLVSSLRRGRGRPFG